MSLSFRPLPTSQFSLPNSHFPIPTSHFHFPLSPLSYILTHPTQFHQTGQLKSQLGFLFNAGLQSPPYDGIAELFARDMEHFTQFMTKVLGDAATQSDIARFVDTTQPLQVMAGYDNLVFGSAAPGMGGQDGILPGDDRLVYDCEEGN